jgi:hypothetical protein
MIIASIRMGSLRFKPRLDSRSTSFGLQSSEMCILSIISTECLARNFVTHSEYELRTARVHIAAWQISSSFATAFESLWQRKKGSQKSKCTSATKTKIFAIISYFVSNLFNNMSKKPERSRFSFSRKKLFARIEEVRPMHQLHESLQFDK